MPKKINSYLNILRLKLNNIIHVAEIRVRKFQQSILEVENDPISKVNVWHEFLPVIQYANKSKSILRRQEIDGPEKQSILPA